VFKDKEIFNVIESEKKRQFEHIELIASENFVSQDVLMAQGSILTNKYAEGYPKARYYGGCEYVDEIEDLAISRLKKLFSCDFANVQPHSGSQANQGVMLALLKPHETILGMSLDAGGHLTHGSKVNLSGKWFNSVAYGVDEKSGLLDYDCVEVLALEHKPKLIIAGGSAYSRIIDFSRFRSIADKVGAFLLVDMAHFAGIVAAGYYPSPFPYADVVTSTTHKTLRGPRGGIILTNNQDIAKKIDSAVFPGLQGGPLMHVIAGKAIAFFEALQPSFKTYIKNVLDNAKALSESLKNMNFNIISGGTDSHLLLVDLSNFGVTGKDACFALEQANITCNKNGIPKDPHPPKITSGIRLGTPACTTRGFGTKEFIEVSHMINSIVCSLKDGRSEKVIPEVREQALNLCKKFPL
jgi:glycine hydroxymethyltransferase